jgi:hypothetical protein
MAIMMSITMIVMAMIVMAMTIMVMSTMAFIITWLALRINIARMVIVIWWRHNDHSRDTNVKIDRCPRGDGPYADRQPREHSCNDDLFHADLLR